MPDRTLFLGLILVAGCGGSGTAPVSGTVTLNGKPLVRATVVFEPIGDGKNPGPGSTGVTDDKGRFTLTGMTTGSPGALVGKHIVRITAYDGDGEVESSAAPTTPKNPFRKAILPAEYNAQTQLSFEVPAGGTTAADFALTSGVGKAK